MLNRRPLDPSRRTLEQRAPIRRREIGSVRMSVDSGERTAGTIPRIPSRGAGGNPVNVASYRPDIHQAGSAAKPKPLAPSLAAGSDHASRLQSAGWTNSATATSDPRGVTPIPSVSSMSPKTVPCGASSAPRHSRSPANATMASHSCAGGNTAYQIGIGLSEVRVDLQSRGEIRLAAA